jgi:hypothetical protein
LIASNLPSTNVARRTSSAAIEFPPDVSPLLGWKLPVQHPQRRRKILLADVMPNPTLESQQLICIEA